MKKLISILIAITMIISQTFAFADVFDDYYEISSGRNMTSAKCSASLGMTLDSPLEFMNAVNTIFEKDNPFGSFFNPDFKAMTEGIAEFSCNMDYSATYSTDYKKMQMELNAALKLPFTVTDGFKTVTDYSYSMWMDYDFTDMENPVYDLIIKQPLSTKYISMDYIEMTTLTNSDFDFAGYMNSVMDNTKKIIDGEYADRIKDSLRKNADLKFSASAYTLKLDDKGAKAVLADFCDVLDDYMAESLPFLNDGDVVSNDFIAAEEYVPNNTTEPEPEQELETTEPEDISFDPNNPFAFFKEEIFAPLNDVKIFGDKGINIVCRTNGNNPSNVTSTVQIDTNLFDILSALNVKPFEGLTTDNGKIAFTFSATSKFTDINQVKTVKYPPLTETNSVDMVEYIKQMQEKYDSYEYADKYINKVVYCTEFPVYRDDMPYYPLTPILGEFNVPAENIIWNGDGTVTVKGFSDTELPFGNMIITLNSNIVNCDGIIASLDSNIIEADGKTYVNEEFLKKFFGAEYCYYSINYNYDTNRYETCLSLELLNPEYMEK